MSEIKTGGPAFPHDDRAQYAERAGMTLREYFAAKAMQSYLHRVDADDWELSDVAAASYAAADAMLAHRHKGGAA